MAPVPFEKHSIQYVVHVTDSWRPYDETIELIIIIIAFFFMWHVYWMQML